MKKQEQIKVNEYVLANYRLFENHYDFWRFNNEPKPKKLRTCSASVIETDCYYILRSYSTIIAVIDKFTGELFDFLRYVYGYTATSAQHIAKFAHDYNYTKCFTYRHV